jgi:hypothetical protein
LIQADPQDVIAFILNYDDSRFAKSEEAANPNVIRFECVAHMNAHHSIGFARHKVRGLRDRTFLYSLVASQVAAQPSKYVVVVVPIPSHAKIGEKDEAGAVRGESCKSFRLTEVAQGVTKLECSWLVDLKGLVPHFVADTIEAPTHMRYVDSLQRYFQQIKPLAKCDAEDGRLVGELLLEVVERTPNDLAHAIRMFANCTTMLRECGFRHIDLMLVRLLTADAHVGPDSDKDVANVAPNPSSVTEEQAAAIGSVIASVRLSDAPAVALKRVVKSLAVLRAMKSCFVWFVPMLEGLAVPKIAQPRRSTLMERLTSTMERLTSIATARAPVAPIDAVSDAGIADEGSGFSTVVRPSGHNTHATMRSIPRYRMPRTARDQCRCLWMRV